MDRKESISPVGNAKERAMEKNPWVVITAMLAVLVIMLGWSDYQNQILSQQSENRFKELTGSLDRIQKLLDKHETPPQFEYRIEDPSDASFDTEMDAWGTAGWELVSARRAGSEYSSPKYEVILMRQKR
jgi:hypothetical protein